MRAISTVLLIALAASVAVAQDYPRSEFFGGYSFVRTEEESVELSPFGLPPGTVAKRSAGNLNGWNIAITGNPTSWLGIVADFGGAYGNLNYSLTGVGSTDARSNFHSFLFGPQFYIRGRSTTFFARGLAGAVKLDQSATLFGTRGSRDETAFAYGVGGGIDFKLSSRISARPIQADLVFTRFDGQGISKDTQKTIRLSTGFVFRN